MNTSFQIDDPTLESQWKAIILFGKNSVTYEFAFAKLHFWIEKHRTKCENKLYFRFEMALSAAPVAKVVVWLCLLEEKRETFSMRTIKFL